MSQRLRSWVLPVTVYLNTAVCLTAQEAEYPPGTYRLTPTTDLQLQPTRVQVPARFLREAPDDLVLNLPPGFAVKLYHIGGLRRPRQMAVGPDGVLYVANMKRYDLGEYDSEIVALPDRDGDGVADTAYVAAGNLHMVNSLAFHGDEMFVAEADGITRLRDEDGDGVFEQRVALVTDIPAQGWHTTRTIVIDPALEKIYVGVGAPCDLCRSERPYERDSLNPLPPTPEWGSILQFDLDGGGRRIYATGMRNVVGLALHPVTGELWGAHNGHDREGPDLPPEWIDVIPEGGFMGFPFVYGYRVPVDFEIGLYRDVGVLPLTGKDSLLIESQRRPVALIPAHLAPLGMHFYTQDRFPEEYRNAAFVAVHGGQADGNLAVVPGFKVIVVFSEPDGGEARVGDFLTGFGTDDEGSDVWGKPAGVISDDEGYLYVTSDHRMNAVFRVEPTPLSGSWSLDLPDTTAVGSRLALAVTVRVTRFDPDGQLPVVVADLSAVGGGGGSAAGSDLRRRLRTADDCRC
jgi:glucose/arabinose dehydrogenase